MDSAQYRSGNHVVRDCHSLIRMCIINDVLRTLLILAPGTSQMRNKALLLVLQLPPPRWVSYFPPILSVLVSFFLFFFFSYFFFPLKLS